MSPFEIIIAVINILAIVIIPILAVYLGRSLQDKSERRKDKMQIFQCLMTRRITGWAGLDTVNALNSRARVSGITGNLKEAGGKSLA